MPIQRIIAREPFTDEQNERLCDGMQRYHKENIHVISSDMQTPESIRRAAVRMKNSEGLELIVVDYLQRLNIARTGANRADEIGSIAASLKTMAVDLNVPVLTAAQFNREAAAAAVRRGEREDAGVPRCISCAAAARLRTRRTRSSCLTSRGARRGISAISTRT